MLPIFPENRSEILQNLQTDFVTNIPESDPFVRESWLLALLIAISNREFDIYTQLSQVLTQLFPTTAEGIFARQWGNLKGVEINPATSATGFISVGGTIFTVIPEGTLWASSTGIQYESKNQDYTINDTSIQVSSLTSSGGIAEAITTSSHHLASGMQVDITGADQAEYNVTNAIITVIDEVTFKYNITGSPVSPATGTNILVTATFASVFVGSLTAGNIANLGSGARLTLVNPLAGVVDPAFVQHTELGGGSDDETNEEYRARYLERYQGIQAHFNESDIVATAKEVAGVTDVFVQRITPQVGDVTVYFMRYDDPDPIPSPQEVTDVKNKLSIITPANVPISDTAGLIVKAPIALPIDFTFSNLNPNTETMKTAIELSLAQFFIERSVVGVNISSEAYRSAIADTVDPATGLFVESFNLTIPIGEIVVPDGQIATLGTITFAV